jgi:hypothetical protein
MPCICDQCDLFAQVTCPRVSPDGKEMCLNFQGAQTNSLQQLKAEIAALVHRFDNCATGNEVNTALDIIGDLRKLLAV